MQVRLKKHLPFLLIVVTLGLLFGVGQVSANQTIERISSSDRLGTAIEISKKGWTTSPTVILARSDHPADALAAAGLVATKNAPILLTDSDQLDSRIINEIRRLKATQVYLLGGTMAISSTVEEKLKNEFNVKRISGKERFTTAYEINKEAGLLSNDTAIIVNGKTVADALSASSVAANKGFPIYLADQNRLPVDLPQSVRNVLIFGGTAAISQSFENSLVSRGLKITRISGSDRYETSIKVAQWAGLSGDANILVRGTSVKNSGEDYPDAVAASGLAKRLQAPIILTHPTNPSSKVIDYLSNSNQRTTILGGTAAVSASIVDRIQNANQPQTVQYGTVKVSSTLNVRNAPVSGDRIGALSNGTKVEIHEVIGGWAKIKYGSGWGYISLTYVTISQPSSSSPVAGEIIAIDAGHGGKDGGAAYDGIVEKELVLDVALRVEKKLEAQGARVVMTRRDDTFIELVNRAKIANEANASSFISIHANGFRLESANGTETYWSKDNNSKELATLIQNLLYQELGTTNRGVKSNDYSVLRNTKMPAVLVELGFLSNKSDSDKLKTTKYREKAANAIYEGIVEYYRKR
ncbi:N-acetylmuramoyl-L-alanine amidase [Bacillus suaedae]|uniref:N-acetylmuramoyl-L-alanine amidase n=1 Tax=Halalkalibacter suaedae TaxID=2822140 RepID=A0A940WXI7_9BACI|nr:N-acetylmuramoyl-L-alanine amidase [Bacillus suaedae]MBP3950076.1 N-acetylmuramoyl-L-alanine amidase [Bacillus suaedae]